MTKIPINIATGTLQKEVRVEGIDPGTTNSPVPVKDPKTKVEVKPQHGLAEEAEPMSSGSVTHAKDDIETRLLAEARTEGEDLLYSTEKLIQQHLALLSQDELIETAEAIQALQLALTMEDKNLIWSKIESLTSVSRRYSERILDQETGGSLKGTSV